MILDHTTSSFAVLFILLINLVKQRLFATALGYENLLSKINVA
jgi:hypothetical protein